MSPRIFEALHQKYSLLFFCLWKGPYVFDESNWITFMSFWPQKRPYFNVYVFNWTFFFWLHFWFLVLFDFTLFKKLGCFGNHLVKVYIRCIIRVSSLFGVTYALYFLPVIFLRWCIWVCITAMILCLHAFHFLYCLFRNIYYFFLIRLSKQWLLETIEICKQLPSFLLLNNHWCFLLAAWIFFLRACFVNLFCSCDIHSTNNIDFNKGFTHLLCCESL